MNIHLRQFLEQGELGAIHLGMAPDPIRKLLGPPERAAQQETLWKYQGLQLSFAAKKLVFIGLYFTNGFHLPEGLTFVGYFPHGHTTVDNLCTYLRKEALPYQINARLTYESQLCLQVGTRAMVIFDTAYNYIDSIQVT